MENSTNLKISIITVCFNSGKTLEKTIRSVIKQTYSNIEYIIIDGKSTDDTIEIIKKYQDNIDHWISEPDDGIYDAMNKGLALATGDIIGIINSDDWYSPYTLESVARAFTNNDCDVVHGDIVRVYEDINLLIRCKPSNIEQIWHKTVFFHPTLFVKREVYQKIGCFSTKFYICGDYEFLIRLYKNKVKFFYDPDNLVFFRMGGASDKNFEIGYKEIRQISMQSGYNNVKAYAWYYYRVMIRKSYSLLYTLRLIFIIKAYFKINSDQYNDIFGDTCQNHSPLPPDNLVSIIMPTYNSADFIKDAIESVLAQTYENWELIIVDDCSTDNTVEIIKNFADPRIKLLHTQKNSGGAVARNIAIKHAQGRFIAFLDADDMWQPEKLTIQIDFMLRNDYYFTFTEYQEINEIEEPFSILKKCPAILTYSKQLKYNHLGCLTCIYDSEKIGKVYMPEIRKRQDYALWLSILKKGVLGYGLNKNLATYRVHSNSLSSNKIFLIKWHWKIFREIEQLPVMTSAYYVVYNVLAKMFLIIR